MCAVFLALLFFAEIYPQTAAAENAVTPAPPIEGLMPVRHPDLKGVEAEVCEQIVFVRESLQEIAKKTLPDTSALSEAYAAMGQIYHAYAFLEAAEANYLNASRLAPKDFRWMYLLGKIHTEQNKIFEAIELYKKAEALRPDYLPVHTSLGEAYLKLDLLPEAKKAFENALELAPNDAAALYGAGQVLYAEKEFRQAAALFEKVLALVPEANRVHYSMALALRGLNEIEKAKAHLAKQGVVGVRSADPLVDRLQEFKKGVRLRLVRGKAAIEAGRFAEAEIELQKALEAEPDNVTALVNYSVALVNLKKFPEALQSLEKAVALDSRNTNARYNLAIIYSASGRHFQAIPHLKAILEMNPKDEPARFRLAVELSRADLLQESLSEFFKLYESSPKNEDVVIELAKTLSKTDDHRRALEILEKSFAEFPDRVRTAALLAYLLAASPQAELRDGKKALELARKVYDSTKLVEHGAVVAMAFAELGQCSEAANFVRTLLAEAEKLKALDLTTKLENELKRYENEKPCRVPNLGR